MEMNGHDRSAKPAINQAELFGLGFQYAIDNVGAEINKEGQPIEADAILFALATKLGEQLGDIMDAGASAAVERKVWQVARKTALLRRAERGLQG